MMASTPIAIGGETFPTKQALKQFLSESLKNTSLGARVSRRAASVLRELIEFHPDAERKIGDGIVGITVRTLYVGPGKGMGRSFFIERLDGTRVDFSFHKCLSEISGTGFREREVKNKLRAMVAADIAAYRSELPDVTECALTGRSIRRDVAHIDHAYPWTFSKMIERFLVQERLTWTTFPIGPSGDAWIGRIVTDAGVAHRWRETHRFRSHLRPVDPDVNSKVGERDPATVEIVRGPFNDWVEDNRRTCRGKSVADKERQREFMLPRITEVFWAHQKFLRSITHQHEMLAERLTGDLEDEWFEALLTFLQDEKAA